jgi:ABC-type sugar transport system permease subunit
MTFKKRNTFQRIGDGFKRFMSRYNDMPKGMRKGKYLFIFLMAFPALASFALWYVAVNFNMFVLAFQDPLTGRASLVNFTRLWEDVTGSYSAILPALKNTMFFFIFGTLVMPVVVYFIAYFFYKQLTGHKVFITVLFLPSMISGIVISTLFINLVSPAGPISYLLFQMTGKTLTDYLHQNGTSVWMIIFFQCWFGLTGNLLLFLGTFKRLPDSVIESARLDGASSMQELFYIITPMVWTTISTIMILSLAGIFTASGPILLFTNGAYDTFTISFWIFLQVKDNALYNYPAAVGLAFTILGLPIVMLIWKLMSKVQGNVEF